MTRFWIALAVAVLLSACSSVGSESATTATAPIDPESVLITVEQTGGCMMMGPNCPTYVVHANGRVDVHRSGRSGGPVDSTFVDPALATDLAWLIDTTDFVQLRAGLPNGECQGCYDGIDTVLFFSTPSGDEVFDSIETKLDPSEPLFAAVWEVVDAASHSTAMPLEQR